MIQKKYIVSFSEKILGVRKSTNLDAINGDLGRYPMKVHWKIEAIIYWIKILKLNNNSLMERMYNVIKENANNNISYADKNWAYQIKKLLGELGLMNLQLNQDTYNITFEAIQLRSLDIFKQSWYSNINNVSRLSTYSLYMNEFEFEEYLKHYMLTNLDTS